MTTMVEVNMRPNDAKIICDQVSSTQAGGTPASAAPATTAPAPAVPANPTVAPGTPLATSVRLAGAGLPAEPHSVEHVLDSVTASNPVPGHLAPPGTALASPDGFSAWMASPQNQAALGLTQVGTGPGSFLAVRPGDVVVGALHPGDQIIAVVGDDGNLYNGGPIGPASALADVHGVYRPTTSQTTLWS